MCVAVGHNVGHVFDHNTLIVRCIFRGGGMEYDVVNLMLESKQC